MTYVRDLEMTREDAGVEGPGAEVAEVYLLVPAWQVEALEEAARRRGMTTAQALRGMIAELVGRPGEGGSRG
jgi:hypothetical protein